MSKFNTACENKKKRSGKTQRKHKIYKHTTRKLIKKGGDIMYYTNSETDNLWGLNKPTENIICSENTTCLAYDDVADQVKKLFDGFVKFNFARKVIKRIGSPSVNGFVFEIKNQTRGYTAYSVLKSAQEPASDNLMYEYNVGLYVNKINKIYPCFLETYGLFKYKSEHQWELFKNIPAKRDIVNLNALQTALQPQPLDYTIGCTDSKYMAVLIQHLPQPKSLGDFLYNTVFIKDELMGALFQLYMPLSKLKYNFTHYDLHLDNILMYEPVVGKYIEYHYHYTPKLANANSVTDTTRKTKTAQLASLKADTIKIKSSYMLKIIDYGRSFFKDEDSNINSKQIYENICSLKPACDSGPSTCGATYGLSWLEDNSLDPLGSYYISSQKANISHDLLPLTRIYEKHTNTEIVLSPELIELGRKIIYTDYFGTAENLLMGYPKDINNVEDACNFIMNCVKKPEYIAHNNAVNRTKEKLGDLHIFMDGSNPMNFIPS